MRTSDDTYNGVHLVKRADDLLPLFTTVIMMRSTATSIASRSRLWSKACRATSFPWSGVRYYSFTSEPRRAAVKESPSATHPEFSGSRDGAGSANPNGISVRERLENVVKEGQASGGVDSFGFEISGKESTTPGKAKSQGRPIYLDMQVSCDRQPIGLAETSEEARHLPSNAVAGNYSG